MRDELIEKEKREGRRECVMLLRTTDSDVRSSQAEPLTVDVVAS